MKRFLLAMMMVLVLSTSAFAAGVLADSGATTILNTILVSTATQDLKLHLFCTNVTPNATGTDTVSTYTECTGGGYAVKTLTRGASWTVAGTAPATATYTQQVFTFTGALTTNGTIYGYFVTDNAGTTLMWSEATTTFTPANNNDHYDVTPSFKMSYGTAQ